MIRSIAGSNMPNRKLSSNQSCQNIFIGVAPMLLLLSTVQALLTSSRLGGMPSPMNSLSSTIAYKALAYFMQLAGLVLTNDCEESRRVSGRLVSSLCLN
ncbi:hypothetical protein V1522DRAFT_148001 [Lipomyces starkeyi]